MKDQGKRLAKCLMIQGTSSHCGKTLLVTSLCRIFRAKGWRVAPFKAQNMSLNSFVTSSGEEIARAQALQARACGLEPTADMNPILLKPKGNSVCQIVLHGKPRRDIAARDYFTEFAPNEGLRAITESLERLRKQYELVIIEGAGSPVEINIANQEIANMKIAHLAKAPVVLVADIDRGGVFASILGTMRLLKKKDRETVKGIIINKFRGDKRLLTPGIKQIRQLIRKPVLGVIDFIEDLRLPREDSLDLDERKTRTDLPLDAAVVRLPRISNFTDFDPLAADGFNVRYASDPWELEAADLVILPGTKNTVEDLEWLRAKGFDKAIRKIADTGTPVIGICGGFQILGTRLHDKGVESNKQATHEGLGLLDVETFFESYEKQTKRVNGTIIAKNPLLASVSGAKLAGYEIHMGKTSLGTSIQPLLEIEDLHENRSDGATNEAGTVFGTYLHGLFDDPPVRQALKKYLLERPRKNLLNHRSIDSVWDSELTRLANAVKASVDIQKIERIIRRRF